MEGSGEGIASMRGFRESGVESEIMKDLIERTEMRLNKVDVRVPCHNNTVDRGSRAADGRGTIHNSDCHNRSFVTSWSAKREKETGDGVV